MTQKCPFCGTGSVVSLNTASIFRCGTKGPNESGEYETGTECDKTVFCNAYLRCLGLLEELVSAVEESDHECDDPPGKCRLLNALSSAKEYLTESAELTASELGTTGKTATVSASNVSG